MTSETDNKDAKDQDIGDNNLKDKEQEATSEDIQQSASSEQLDAEDKIADLNLADIIEGADNIDDKRGENVDDEDLIWHRDENERLIYVIHVDPGWSFQRDNKLPQEMISNKTVIRIKAGEYHRIIKGDGVCILYIEEK